MNERIALIIGGVEALAIAIIALLAYVLGWDSEFAALIVGVISAAIALVGAIYTGTQTVANVEVERRVKMARIEGRAEGRTQG